MKILNNEQSLFHYLTSLSKKKITIITAFASGTENVIAQLLANNNNIELLAGTINAFTSPDFIRFCRDNFQEAFKTYIDFGYELSTHWKLYLIEPDIVIIGRPNFTTTGLSLSRDTCVVIDDKNLYVQYIGFFNNLKNSQKVIPVDREAKFCSYFEKYCEIHSRMQAGMVRAKHYDTLEAWLEDESNQFLPLFIWHSELSKKEELYANQLYSNKVQQELKIGIELIDDILQYKAEEDELPYQQVDVVLCAKDNGSYLEFRTFDTVIFQNGFHYIYVHKNRNRTIPFDLRKLGSGSKKAFKEIIRKIKPEDNFRINRKTLRRILTAQKG